MVVDDLDVESMAGTPDEADPPLLVHADAELPRTITFELLKAIRRRHTQILQDRGRVEHPELPKGDSLDIGAKSLDGLSPEEALGVAVLEGLDHACTITRAVITVKRYYSPASKMRWLTTLGFCCATMMPPRSRELQGERLRTLTAYRVSSKPLLGGAACHTLSYMKTSALTIRLDPELEQQLDRLAERTGRSRSEIVREALRRQLAVSQFQELRTRMMPFAEAAGYLTDEDVFRDVS